MKPMRAWFDLLHSKTKDPNAHYMCYTNPVDSPYFTDDVLAQGDKLFDEATNSAPTTRSHPNTSPKTGSA